MSLIEMAKSQLTEKVCFAAAKESFVFTSGKSGIKSILNLLKERPEIINGASVADKIVGKSAALLLIHGGVREIFATTMSEHAKEILENSNVCFSFMKLVPFIESRDGSDICPMEKRVLDICNPAEAMNIFSDIIC